MRTHELLLLTPDGSDFQIDFPRYYEEPEKVGVEEIWEFSNDLGSKWYFYPFHFVVKAKTFGYYASTEINNRRIVDTPCGLEFLRGLSVKTVRNWLKNNQEEVNLLLSI